MRAYKIMGVTPDKRLTAVTQFITYSRAAWNERKPGWGPFAAFTDYYCAVNFLNDTGWILDPQSHIFEVEGFESAEKNLYNQHGREALSLPSGTILLDRFKVLGRVENDRV